MIHLILNIILLFAAGGLSIHFARKGKRHRAFLVLSALAIGGLGYFFALRPDFFTALLPFSWAIFYSNIYPIAVMTLIPPAIGLSKSRFQKVRVIILSLMLFGASLLPFRHYILPYAESRGTIIDENGVCRQSTADTCSAAAAVTLLRIYGIETTEAEVVRLALTKKDRGTYRLGLYRALKILAAQKPDLRVRIKKLNGRKLIKRNKPAIITVGLAKNPKTAEEKKAAALWNWQPGAVHDVVFLGADETNPAKIKIGEPEFGFERWQASSLDFLFKNAAIFLE